MTINVLKLKKMKQQLGLLLNRHQRNIKKLKKISSSIDINEINIDKIIQI